ncbi:MAG TPA: MerR family transcriptional regulator [Bacteroidales bacterium]|nr:MerR family transcriptional regulator [Bacteroidales bacterium]
MSSKPQHNPERVYYSIGDLAGMFQVNPSLIRFWEKEFDILKPTKSKKGNRYYTPKDVDNFHLIYHLVKERGYTLQGAREKLKQNTDEILRDFEVIKSLKKVQAFLQNLKKEL